MFIYNIIHSKGYVNTKKEKIEFRRKRNSIFLTKTILFIIDPIL